MGKIPENCKWLFKILSVEWVAVVSLQNFRVISVLFSENRVWVFLFSSSDFLGQGLVAGADLFQPLSQLSRVSFPSFLLVLVVRVFNTVVFHFSFSRSNQPSHNA